MEPGRDVPKISEPIGAHLVGLGSSLTLGPRQLRFAVYRALVDRCLRLYRPPEDANTAPIRVGVSTALLGVRDDAGLRTEDAVTAILEGVGDVNRRLPEYEKGRKPRPASGSGTFSSWSGTPTGPISPQRRSGARVSSPRSRRTSPVWRGSAPSSGDGALPAGAAVLEQDRSWTRFSVTERPTSGDRGTSVIEVTVLGRDARADRVTHQIDRASLDALMTRLSVDPSNRSALEALRDRLIPHDLRADFLAGANLQLVLNEQAAAYSWEQFTAPLVAVNDDAQRAGTGSILRAFAESDDRRLQPVRARVNTALVIGAGHTTPDRLQGAVSEAKEVGKLLRKTEFDTQPADRRRSGFHRPGRAEHQVAGQPSDRAPGRPRSPRRGGQHRLRGPAGQELPVHGRLRRVDADRA